MSESIVINPTNFIPNGKILEEIKQVKRNLNLDLQNSFYSIEECYTIDSETTKDRDDGFNIEIDNENNQIILKVFITLISNYLQFNSPLYEKVRKRLFTRYKQKNTVYMYPEELTKLFSLDYNNPNYQVPAICLKLVLDKKYNIIKSSIYKCLVINIGQYTYKSFSDLLYSKTENKFNELFSLCFYLQEKRLSFHNSKVFCDIDKQIITTEEQNKINVGSNILSYLIVSELMITTNIFLATYCFASNIPIIYRNQDNISKIKDLEYKYFTDIKTELSTNNKAYYSEKRKLHSSLNIEGYSHFTSPLRRFVDTYNLMIMTKYIYDSKPDIYNYNFQYNYSKALSSLINNSINYINEVLSVSQKEKKYKEVLSMPVQELNRKDFTRLIKLFIKSEKEQGNINEFIQELKNRIVDNKLIIHDYYLLIFEGKEKLQMYNLHKFIFENIIKHPDLVAIKQYIDVDINIWELTNEFNITTNEHVFKGTLTDSNKHVITVNANSKKEVEKALIIDYLKHYLGINNFSANTLIGEYMPILKGVETKKEPDLKDKLKPNIKSFNYIYNENDLDNNPVEITLNLKITHGTFIRDLANLINCFNKYSNLYEDLSKDIKDRFKQYLE